MSSTYFAWWGKQSRSGLFQECELRWNLSARHLIRPDSYKGEQRATRIPGLKYDCCTALRLLFILALFAQVRGLAETTQKCCVSLARRLLALADWSKGVKLLPNYNLVVEDGTVNVSGFFDRFPDAVKADLEKRQGPGAPYCE